MSPRIQLPWPRLGLSDDRNAAQQPPMTSRRLRNVRLIDPVTRRERGAQRPGLSKFFSNALGARVDHVASVSYQIPQITYTQLTETTNGGPPGGTTPALITAEWSEALDSEASSVVTDRDGTIYAATADGRVLIYNQDQQLLETIQPPAKPGESVWVHSLAVDEARRVYVAANGLDAASSRVWQFKRVADLDDEDVVYYDLAWELEFPGYARNLVARGGALWIAVDGSAGQGTSRITRYDGVAGSEPIIGWELDCPNPVRGLAVGPTGNVYSTHPSNLNRGGTGLLNGLHVPLLSWTPHDLGYDAAALVAAKSAAQRLHAWVDADYVVGAPWAEVTGMFDRRFVATQNETPANGQPGGASTNPAEYGDGPDDETARGLYKWVTSRNGPTLHVGVVAGKQACFFDRNAAGSDPVYLGQALRSNPNLTGNFKDDTTGPQSSSPATDATDVTIVQAWTALPSPALDITLGATPNATGSYNLDFAIDSNGFQGMYLQATRGGAPCGPEVLFPSNGGTQTYNVSLPINQADLAAGGTFNARIRRNGTFTANIAGTFYVTTATVTWDDYLPGADGSAPDQQAIVPGHYTPSGTPYGAGWTAVSAWRMLDRDADHPQVMAWCNGNVLKWCLLANARVSGGVVAHEPGHVAFLANYMEGGNSVAVANAGPLGLPTVGQQWRGVSGDSSTTQDSDGYAVVSVHHPGQYEANPLGVLRINGSAAGRFRITQTEAYGSGGFVCIGNPHWRPQPDSSDLFAASATNKPYPFHGFFLSWATTLGSTTTYANDTPATQPLLASGPPYLPPIADPSSSQDPGVVSYNDLEPDTGAPPTDSYTGTATELERLEGGLAHAWGLANKLPNNNGDAPVDGLYPDHPFGGSAVPATGFAGDVSVTLTDIALASTRPILAKIAASGSEFLWAYNGSGVGFSVQADPRVGSPYLLTTGEKDDLDVGAPEGIARRVFDGGNTYSTSAADGAWVYSDAGFTPTWNYPETAVDDQGQLYWARREDDNLVKLKGSDGTVVYSFDVGYEASSVALEPDVPIYPEAVDDEAQSPLFVYVSGAAPGGGQLDKLRVVAETRSSAATPRETQYLAVVGADLWTGASGGAASTGATTTGVFDGTRTLVQSAVLGAKWYATDGRRYVVYDALNDRCAALTSAKRGELPKRGKLMCGWNGRLVIARTEDDAQNWYMSAQGDPTDWDYFPTNPSPTDAVNGGTAPEAGRCPDLITSLIPYDDDILLIGGDHTIWKMLGDPLAGGRILQLSDETGIAFGRPYTRDPEGRLYFFGSRGGLWVVSRGTDSLLQAQRISDMGEAGIDVEARLQAIDLSANRVELAWNYKQEGLHLFVIPYGAVPGTRPSCYFWSRKGGWYEDTWGAGGVLPTCSAVFDGDDPDDRVVAVGSDAGYVRFLDPSAATDDGTDIASEVWIGPLSGGMPVAEQRYGALQIALARDQGAADFEWYVSEDPDADFDALVIAGAVSSGSLVAGLNPIDYARARGLYVWLRVLGTSGVRWAYEAATIMAAPAGRARTRT